VQASRLSAVGEMAGGVGHEINNPLGILVGLSNSLSRHASRDKLTNEVAVDISAKIKLTVERIHRVVNGLLNISRKDNKGELTDTKLADVVLTVLDLCGEKIKMNGILMDVDNIDQNHIVKCDSIQISQVILNIKNNAVDALEEQGDPSIKIESIKSNNLVSLEISNNGPEISSDNKLLVMTPFFTTKLSTKGTGLGLSVSKKIMESHNGQLGLRSKAAETAFILEFPV
jgi:C4-dicarboxylate-specific signal transduction histidine kinase